ncbi:MAG: hypothetical protein AABW73_00395 [Nanoarchaeota archaeon]
MGIYIPYPSSNHTTSVSDFVITTLTSKWPLTAKKLHYHIKSYQNCSYQGVHKALKQLLEFQVVEKVGREYFISKDWLRSTANHLKLIEQQYNKPNKAVNNTFIFNSLEEAERFKNDLHWNHLYHGGPQVLYAHVYHLRSPIINTESILKKIEKDRASNNESFIIVHGQTKLDKHCKHFYEQSGKNNVVLGKILENDCELRVMGDTITQMYLPKELISQLDEFYDSASINNLELYKLYGLFKEQHQIRITVTINKEMANLLKKQILQSFISSN